MKVAACRIPEVTSPCQTLGAGSLTCMPARQFVCHKHLCKGPFLASPKIKIFGRTTKTTSFGAQPLRSAHLTLEFPRGDLRRVGRRNSGPGGRPAGSVLKKIVRLASVFPSPPFRSSDFAGPRRPRLYGFHTGTRSLSNRKGARAAKRWTAVFCAV